MTKLGLVGDRHYSTYAEEVRRLEREGDLDYAEALLLYLVEATEAEAKANTAGSCALVLRATGDHLQEEQRIGRRDGDS